jgi:hypothetical protein
VIEAGKRKRCMRKRFEGAEVDESNSRGGVLESWYSFC